MNEGLLWLDANPKTDIVEKVFVAADRYQVKFGQKPNLCYVNQGQLDAPLQINGLRIVPMKNILKHHFLIGVEEL